MSLGLPLVVRHLCTLCNVFFVAELSNYCLPWLVIINDSELPVCESSCPTTRAVSFSHFLCWVGVFTEGSGPIGMVHHWCKYIYYYIIHVCYICHFAYFSALLLHVKCMLFIDWLASVGWFLLLLHDTIQCVILNRLYTRNAIQVTVCTIFTFSLGFSGFLPCVKNKGMSLLANPTNPRLRASLLVCNTMFNTFEPALIMKKTTTHQIALIIDMLKGLSHSRTQVVLVSTLISFRCSSWSFNLILLQYN